MSKVIDRYIAAVQKQKRREAILSGRTRFGNVTEATFDLQVVAMTQEEFWADQPQHSATPMPDENRMAFSEYFRRLPKVKQRELLADYKKHVEATYRMAHFDIKRMEAICDQAE